MLDSKGGLRTEPLCPALALFAIGAGDGGGEGEGGGGAAGLLNCGCFNGDRWRWALLVVELVRVVALEGGLILRECMFSRLPLTGVPE